MKLKSISKDAIPAALEKAERYRLLNEPAQAESICLDIVAVEPDNQDALVMLLLALTDQFRTDPGETLREAQAIVPRLRGEYDRHYYGGIIAERRGHAYALQNTPGCAANAHFWISQAMAHFEEAERVRPANNDDALLRWNHCARLRERYHLREDVGDDEPPPLTDE
jgi:hypothetical protein